jgi:hypothetical protein
MEDWFFPLLGGGEAQGLNEPGVEMFKEADSVARETTQNVLDNPADESKPRRMEFEFLHMPRDSFPGVDRFKSIVSACESSMQRMVRNGSANEDAFFSRALSLLDAKHDTIPTLRIRDTNTTGLHGEDDEEDQPFCRLLKVQGVSSPQGPSGGTYGIGQRAPFHCSALRTIIYYTRRHTDLQQAFIAKSILCTFSDPQPPHQKRQSKGWWCKPDPVNQDSWASLRESQSIPSFFQRSEPGTDLYITGFVLFGNEWKRIIRQAVISNFFAAISLGELAVGITDENGQRTEITKDTLVAELNRCAEEQRSLDPDIFRDGLARTLAYHKAFTAPTSGTPFTASIDPIGEVRLYVHHDPDNPDLPDRWCYMRKPHMLVGSAPAYVIRRFAGVLVCDNSVGNKYLAQLEGPQHREWKASELRNATAEQVKQAQKVDKAIREFVRESLKTLRAGAGSTSLNPLNLGNYLPCNDPGSAAGAFSGQGANLSCRITPQPLAVRAQPVAKPITIKGKRPQQQTPAVQTVVTGQTGTPIATLGGGTATGSGGRGTGNGGQGPTRLTTATTHAGIGSPGTIIKPDAVSFRSFVDGGLLQVVITPVRDVTGHLQITARGEGGRKYAPLILGATDVTTNTAVPFVGSVLQNITLHKGVALRLRLDLDTGPRICLGLEG